ncbi:MAG: replication restart helicase PriA [Rhodoferax sp.]
MNRSPLAPESAASAPDRGAGVVLAVLVHTPAHARLGPVLHYRHSQALEPGTLVRVPLGARETLGLVWDPEPGQSAAPDTANLRDIAAVLHGLAPLAAPWRALLRFTAQYYQRSAGEAALSALPPALREISAEQWQRRLQRAARKAAQAARPASRRASSTAIACGEPPADLETPPGAAPTAVPAAPAPAPAPAPEAEAETARTLSPGQQAVLQAMAQHPGPFLLFGATGSGKTEVYLQAVARVLAQDPQAQALVMVPEINLTPQLQQRFAQRFTPLVGAQAVVALHSGMAPAQRLQAWLDAHAGRARIVLGTRMAVFASLPQLRLIVVDEEHDPSYKSGEGARYSARDLAVYRARLQGAQVLLGSATPSLESWHLSRPASEGGRYLRLEMPQRIGNEGALPPVRRVDMQHQPRGVVFSPPLLEAIQQRVARGEQCLVFMNRRGYAPVLHCDACGWKSQCPHCSACRVFHKIDRSLRCHHCGSSTRVPRACPDCGNVDITPVGRGTEQLEEHLGELLVDVRRPDGSPVRVARIDADTTRLKGSLEAQLAAVHSGEVDVLVGTQMIAKGHDFRRITLVAALNPDGALFSSDFRAPERLFALLMQAAGRAGRDAAYSARSEVWVQTHEPGHPLYVALKAHDYPAFAETQLRERQVACMPPFAAQALVRADARSQEAARAFLEAARTVAQEQMPHWDGWATVLQHITVYPAIPCAMQRVANVERAQMLVESPSRSALQQFLAAWGLELARCRDLPECKGLLRWAVDVDPHSI